MYEIQVPHTCSPPPFKKFYQQFELQIKRFWVFKFEGKVYQLSGIPTGAVLPPFAAQALSHTLLALAVRTAGAAQIVAYDSCMTTSACVPTTCTPFAQLGSNCLLYASTLASPSVR